MIKKLFMFCSLFVLMLQSTPIVAAEAARSAAFDDVDSDTDTVKWVKNRAQESDADDSDSDADTVELEAVPVGISNDRSSLFVYFPEQRDAWIDYVKQRGYYNEIERIYQTLQFASVDPVKNEAYINEAESKLIDIFKHNSDLITRIEDMSAAIQLRLPMFVQYILGTDPFWLSQEAWSRLDICKTLSHAIWRAQGDVITRGEAFRPSYDKMKQIVLVLVRYGLKLRLCLQRYERFVYIFKRDPSLYDLMQIDRPVEQYVQTQTTQQDSVPKVATHAAVSVQRSMPKRLTYAEVATQTLTPVAQEDGSLFGSEDVDDAASDLSMADSVTSDDDWSSDSGSLSDPERSDQEFEDIFGGHTLF